MTIDSVFSRMTTEEMYEQMHEYMAVANESAALLALLNASDRVHKARRNIELAEERLSMALRRFDKARRAHEAIKANNANTK